MVDGAFTFTSLDEATGNETTISGFDDEIKSGFVGIQLYAQQAEFDNFSITPFLDPSLLSDLTGNGFVDFEDLTILLANWNKDVGPELGNVVDPANSLVSFEDLTVLLSEWTGPGPAGSPEAALGAEAVPEPSSMLLTVIATLGWSARWRRRRRRSG